MVAIQAVVELVGMVPAFVWIALTLVIALLIFLTVIMTKKRSREVAELDKLFADSNEVSFDEPLALKRRPRKKFSFGNTQKGKERETDGDISPVDAVRAVKETDRSEKVDEGEKGGDA
jgi:hypothetical protein